MVTGNDVNVRSGPGRSYEVLLQFPKGTKIQALEKRPSWVAVSLPPDVPAYLHRDFIGEPMEGIAPVKGERIQVRARPSTESTSWGEISAPDKVRVLGFHGDWIKIQPPPFCRGWLSADYVAFLPREQQPAATAAEGTSR